METWFKLKKSFTTCDSVNVGAKADHYNTILVCSTENGGSGTDGLQNTDCMILAVKHKTLVLEVAGGDIVVVSHLPVESESWYHVAGTVTVVLDPNGQLEKISYALDHNRYS